MSAIQKKSTRLASKALLTGVIVLSSTWASFSGTAGAESVHSAPETTVIKTPIQNEVGEGPATAILDNQPAMLFNSTEGRVTFLANGTKTVLDETAPVKGGRYFKLYVRGNTVNALWWSHEDQKNLYFAESQNGGKTFTKVKIINSAHGVLPAYDLLAQGDVLGVSYLDERDPQYGVFFNRSTDNGATWGKKDIRIDKPRTDGAPSMHMDPMMQAIGDTWVLIWRDAGIPGAQYNVNNLLMRVSTDAGKTWSDPKIIYGTEGTMSAERLQVIDGQFVLGFADGNRLKLMTISSDGKKWTQAIPVGGFALNTGGGIQMAAASNNNIVVTWVANSPNKKAIIYAATYNLDKNEWTTEAKQIDIKPFDNTQSLSPVVTSLKNGVVVASWVDFRNIIPEIYLSTTTDDGKNWSKPQNIGRNGKSFMVQPKLMPLSNDDLYVGYQYYENNNHKNLEFLIKKLRIEKDGTMIGLPHQAPELTESQKLAKLKARVKELWELRVAMKFDETYPIFDPAMRAGFTKEQFAAGQAKTVYRDVTWEGADIQGNVATVKIKLRMKLPPLMVGGKVMDIPEQTTTAPSTWVLIDDNWYLVYKGPMNNTFLKY